jgi:4-hydroxybenzoate polyprenyltransferase
VGKIFSFFKSIRPVNLFIIVLTQCLVRYCIILPAYEVEKNYTGLYPLHMSEEYFFLLVFSTLLIAAAGYILNDNLDAAIDNVNRPQKKSFAANISRTSAINIYIILTSIAVAIAFFIADSILNFWLGFVQVGSSVLLALYSGVLKKIPLLGNLTVALLSALVLAIPGLYEPSFYPNFTYIFIYSGFAFLLSLIREIVKDVEDIEGDKISGRKTIPMALGMSSTKVILCVLVILTALGIGKVLYDFFYAYEYFSFWKILTCFEIPFLALLVFTIRAKEKKDYSLLSTLLKIFMLLGILTMLPLYYFLLS